MTTATEPKLLSVWNFRIDPELGFVASVWEDEDLVIQMKEIVYTGKGEVHYVYYDPDNNEERTLVRDYRKGQRSNPRVY